MWQTNQQSCTCGGLDARSMETFHLKALKKLSGFFWASLSFYNGPFGKIYSFWLLAKQNMFTKTIPVDTCLVHSICIQT